MALRPFYGKRIVGSRYIAASPYEPLLVTTDDGAAIYRDPTLLYVYEKSRRWLRLFDGDSRGGLFHIYFFYFRALAADKDAVFGVGNAHTLKVVIFNGGVFISLNAFDTGGASRFYFNSLNC